VFSEFFPLKSGTTFNTIIRYHNLKKVELGALISAISFFNQHDKFHSIGGAKPYGYGKVKLSIKEIEKYLPSIIEFENEMNKFLGDRKWIEEERIINLFAMASNPKFDELLNYPEIENSDRENDFLIYKNNKQYLEKYVNQNPISNLVSLVAKKEAEDKEQADKIAEDINKKNELNIEREFNELKSSESIKDLENFRLKYPKYEKEVNDLITELNKKKANERLVLLKEQSLKSNLAGKKFDEFKLYLNNIIRKIKSFNEEQKNDIINAIKDYIKNNDQAFYKKKNKTESNEYPWTEIKKWIDETNVNKLYKEFNP
jgi:hypothetical protein